MTTTPSSPCKPHGVARCALCFKEPGQCDFGDCGKRASLIYTARSASGAILERRPLCAHHYQTCSDLDLRAKH